MFPGVAGGGQATAAAAAAGPVVADLSTWVVDVDPDSIINTISSTTITLNKTGTGHASTDWARLLSTVEIPASYALVVSVKRTNVTNAAKALFAVGIYDAAAANLAAAGINSHGTGVAQTLSIMDTTVTFDGLRTTEDGWTQTFRTDVAQHAMRQHQVDMLIAGEWSQTIVYGSAAEVSQTVVLAAIIAVNDVTGGTTSFDYEVSYLLVPLL